MKRQIFLQKKLRLLSFSIKLRILCLLFLFPVLTIYSQETEYLIKGRVIGENNLPQNLVSVRICPIQDRWEENAVTDEDGKFALTQKHKKGTIWYLFVTDAVTYSKNDWSIIPLASFFRPDKDDKLFTEQPIVFGDEPNINLGEVSVKLWYVDVNLRIQNNRKGLMQQQWKSLWCRLKDGKGRILAESSIGPVIDDKVDLKESLLKLSLPEGKWKIEFQKFDGDKNKIYPKILAQTPFFVVDKKKMLKTIDIKFIN